EHIKTYAELVNGNIEMVQYDKLRKRSIHLFADLDRIYVLLELVNLDLEPWNHSLEGLQLALKRLLARFSDDLTDNYLDYFSDFSPATPLHLGGMLQCAAILERIIQYLSRFSKEEDARQRIP